MSAYCIAALAFLDVTYTFDTMSSTEPKACIGSLI